MLKDHCFLIYGTTRTGIKRSTYVIDGSEIGETDKIDDIIRSYRRMFPDVIHIRLDISLPNPMRMQ